LGLLVGTVRADLRVGQVDAVLAHTLGELRAACRSSLLPPARVVLVALPAPPRLATPLNRALQR
jgi:hypothetical protein